MRELTKHQKSTLAAMVALMDRADRRNWQFVRGVGLPESELAFSRKLIGHAAGGGCTVVRFGTMKDLWTRGLVEPEHEVAVRLVESKVCQCSCDRWRITNSGRELVSTWRVVGTHARAEQRKDERCE